MPSGTVNNYRLVTVDQIDRSKLNDFLSRFYGSAKGKFLYSHGGWWHRGEQHRWVLMVNSQIAGYCGVIPTKCLIDGVEEPGWWWVDLVVAPKFRGKGLQTIFDREIRQNADIIKLGLPNKLASQIHRKHGWGLREDLRVLMLPLRPMDVRNVWAKTGFRSYLLRLAAIGVTPLAALWRHSLKGYSPLTARVVESLSVDLFESVFDKYNKNGTITTYRDAEYFKWRYIEAPYCSELVFYLAGPFSSPTHFLIARHVNSLGYKATRILDLFGDFDDLEGLRDILKLSVRDAILQGSSQVTVLVTLPELRSVLRSIGFLIRAKVRLCWFSASQAKMRSLSGRSHWTLADSDSDAPE